MVDVTVVRNVAFDRAAVRRFLLGNLPFIGPEIPWGLGLSLPDADMVSTRNILQISVVLRVFPEGPRVSALDHRGVEVCQSHFADTDDPPVTVLAAIVADDVFTKCECFHRGYRLLSASPRSAGRGVALLTRLGGIDTVKAVDDARNFESVAVHNSNT